MRSFQSGLKPEQRTLKSLTSARMLFGRTGCLRWFAVVGLVRAGARVLGVLGTGVEAWVFPDGLKPEQRMKRPEADRSVRAPL
jgi:hypothetical protein